MPDVFDWSLLDQLDDGERSDQASRSPRLLSPRVAAGEASTLEEQLYKEARAAATAAEVGILRESLAEAAKEAELLQQVQQQIRTRLEAAESASEEALLGRRAAEAEGEQLRSQLKQSQAEAAEALLGRRAAEAEGEQLRSQVEQAQAAATEAADARERMRIRLEDATVSLEKVSTLEKALEKLKTELAEVTARHREAEHRLLEQAGALRTDLEAARAEAARLKALNEQLEAARAAQASVPASIFAQQATPLRVQQLPSRQVFPPPATQHSVPAAPYLRPATVGVAAAAPMAVRTSATPGSAPTGGPSASQLPAQLDATMPHRTFLLPARPGVVYRNA